MTKVQLPEGCYGLDMADGKKYKANRPGGTVEVSSKDAHYIDTSFYGQQGIMTGRERFSFGTRKGQWCGPCRRLWNVWNKTCPKCGAETETHGGTS